MALGFRVQTVVFVSGERFPLLVESATGIPLFYPTLFTVSELRARNLASATLAQALRAILVLNQILEHMHIDLQTRFSQGKVLELDEIDCIARLCRFHQEALDSFLAPDPPAMPRARTRTGLLERIRMATSPTRSPKEVAKETAAIRLLYIRDYLGWLTRRHLLAIGGVDPLFQHVAAASAMVTAAFSERMPAGSNRNAVHARKGMSKEELERLLSVIAPDSPENPWRNMHVRRRNQLIFLWLLKLGLRKSELLVVRLDDLDFQSNEVLIARRPDNPEDPRADLPNTKTRDRLLTMDPQLADLTRTYILNERRQLAGARRHPFLIVATRTGAPLTRAAVNKLFVELRTKVPGLPDELSPHVLRHTWNDKFSELMDEKGVTPELEERLRIQQMGWSERSKAAATYTRRHIERKAKEVSLALQEKIYSSSGGKSGKQSASSKSADKPSSVVGNNPKRRRV